MTARDGIAQLPSPFLTEGRGVGGEGWSLPVSCRLRFNLTQTSNGTAGGEANPHPLPLSLPEVEGRGELAQ
jgi:hypothetical protein